MNRLLVVILSALDTLIQVAVGLAVVAAPFTALWIFGFGGHADWAALWPATASVWQLGNLVPIEVTFPVAFVTNAAVPAEAASFLVSLAPLAFAAFTVAFGFRSGSRAARSGAWITGAVTSFVAALALAAIVAVTSRNAVAEPPLWAAIVVPALLYGLATAAGGVLFSGRGGDEGGPIDRLHDRLDRASSAWQETAEGIARGVAVSLAGLIGVSGIAVAIALLAGGADIVALYQAANVDVTGAIVLSLGQLVYLPTLIVWGLSWLAGPGFALGEGTSVSPLGTDVGVLPGIPVLGAVPQVGGPWLLLVVLLPVGVGVLAGWIVRSRHAVADGADDPVAPRLVLALGTAVGTAAAIALLGWTAAGAIGPGHLAVVGPAPGALAIAVGVEVFIGAAVILLSPRARDREAADHVAV